ncbi:pyridoxal 5'-phosphate synthase [uncultured Dokdonia sp.]|uniref:pyridoxine/pyridoxamine 5'-phosphate oxidase n=1 Tax=uncultured Dokdonia sp. TaxID=575653 RepID=UPI0026027A74|nr:pyridoxal 5'-phosphate synthase [uncultured Dokdonia sp.]
MNIAEYPEPIDTFVRWLHEHVTITKSSYSSACILSTQGLDGFPNARNVSLKCIEKPYFIITGSTLSRKGKEIETHPKVALTFWWEETKRQVRIQGTASQISEKDAHFFFKDRSYESQIVSSISKQGMPLKKLESLRVRFRESIKSQRPIEKPTHWSGWKIKPYRIEFLEFNTSRFHNRVLYTQSEDSWNITQLQP